MRVSKSTIDKLTFAGAGPNAKDVRWDDQTPGFGVRVFPSGKKSFVLSYRFQGRQRLLTLGTYGPITPDQARKLALQALAQLSTGVDPLAARQRAARGETVASLCADYMVKYSKPHKRSWEGDQSRIDRYVLPALGTTKVRALTHRSVSSLHNKIGVDMGFPRAANMVLELLRGMINWGRKHDFIDHNAPNPADGIKKFPEIQRERFVTKDEMPALAKAIDEEENVFAQAALWLYLLTSLRKQELLKLRWSPKMDNKGNQTANYVDLAAAEIELVNTKNGKKHRVPLSEPAVAILAKIPRLAGNPYVFCGAREGKHLINMQKPWDRVRTAAGLADVRLHDLRRTVGSWMAMSGASLLLIGKTLNNSGAATRIYARFQNDPVAVALGAHARELLAAAGSVSLPALAAASDEVDANSRDSK